MHKTDLQEIYHAHHQGRGRYGYLYCHGARIPYLQQWIGQGKKVLDLGCRDGMLTAGYAEGNEVLGIDVDQHALKLAEQRLGIQTQWLDLNAEWPFAAGSFDVIVACEIMEHLFFLDQFLDRVQNTLRPGGLFIGSVPNAFRFRNRLRFLLGHEIENDPTHVRMFSRGRLFSVLKQRFSEVEIVPLQGKVLPFLPVSEKLPVGVNALFAKDLLWRAKKD
jgi:2-polyprenyl-3-methyl-5-hydroxy-6-metoxy-1,4-benzoquinol methylase